MQFNSVNVTSQRKHSVKLGCFTNNYSGKWMQLEGAFIPSLFEAAATNKCVLHFKQSLDDVHSHAVILLATYLSCLLHSKAFGV